jgi:hypothetical protein
MNYAIIIGVSEYDDPSNNLSGCKNDTLAMKELLDNANKFDDILLLDSKINSSSLKDKLTQFITDKKEQNVSELFFYFTGHGEFYQDEFYYILSDFDKEKRRQTSLQNSEIDSLIKSLSPNIVVKVIDSCQSGVTYVKDINNTLSKYFQQTREYFNKCYFLNSCLDFQRSYQSGRISDFTLSFIKSITEHSKDDIRYKDIIDYISDDFEKNQNQTPFFVSQADFTEIFCTIPKETRNKLKIKFKPLIENPVPKKEETPKPKFTTLSDIIATEAVEYSTQKETIELINSIGNDIKKRKLIEELETMYDLQIELLNYDDDIPKMIEIGEWLKDNEHSYFAKPHYAKVRYQEEVPVQYNSLSSLSSLLNQAYPKTVTRYRNDVTGFDLNFDVPFKVIKINCNSKYPNISSYNCTVVYLVSKKDIKFYYFFTQYVEENWESRRISSNFKWISVEQRIKNASEVLSVIKKIFDDFNLYILNILNSKYKNDLQTAEKKTNERTK